MYSTLLNVRSEYCFLNSLIKIDKYVEFAKKQKLHYLSLSDFNSMHYVMHFYNACIKNDIKPILSLNTEIVFNDKIFNVNLIAKNISGYFNLCKISTFIFENKSKITEKFILKKYFLFKELIIVINIEEIVFNEIYNFISKYISLEDIYFGLLKNTNMNLIINKVNVDKIIFNYEINFLYENDFKTFDCIELIKNQKKINNNYEPNFENYYFNNDFINNLHFTKYLQNINFILNKCDVKINSMPINVYKYKNIKNISSYDYIFNLCKSSLKDKINNKEKYNKYLFRLKYELEIINNKNLIDYFLVVFDYVNFAKNKQIMVGPGRGSASGSLVAYLLGITFIDPIENDLLFERFLNSERMELPDIDIDFADDRRNEILKYLFDKYGKYNVATIVTFQTIGFKSAIRDIGKILKIDLLVINTICKNFEINKIETIEKLNILIKNNIFFQNINQKYPDLFEHVKKIHNLPKHISTHASGIVISNTPLIELIPLHSTSFGMMQTQISMNYLSTFGLIKMDLLGLRNLSFLNKILNLIKKHYNKNIELKSIPLNDFKTFKLLQSGFTKGIFQLESDGMKFILNKMRVSSFIDIVSTIALYRPGPIKYINKFIENKFNSKNIKYFNNSFKKILFSTYGIIIFQEQVMLIVKNFANFSLTQADVLRIAMSKKDKNKMENIKNIFFDQAKKNNYSLNDIEYIWNQIFKFSEYGFNKSHAISYALIGYWLSYFKANYSDCFYASVFSSIINSNNFEYYLNEIKIFKIKIQPPSINNPILDFSVNMNNQIFIPINFVKGISMEFVLHLRKEINDNGFFKSFMDFVKRMSVYNLKNVYKNLVYSGCLDVFNINKTSLIKNFDLLNNIFMNSIDKLNLYDNFHLYKIQIVEDNMTDLIKMEKKYLGFNLQYNMFENIKNDNKLNNLVSISDIISSTKNYDENYNILGILKNINFITDKNNESMAFLKVVDDSNNQISIIVFSKDFKRYNKILKINNFYVMNIKSYFYKNNKNFTLVDLKNYTIKFD